MNTYYLINRFTRNKHHLTQAVYQTEFSILIRMKKLFSILLLLICLHIIAMVILENMPIWQAFWLSITTITTVGYGDMTATTPYGQAATVILLYLLGISFLAQFASEYIDYRIAKRERIRKGRWYWNMANHIAILNAPVYNSEQYFIRLISQIRENPEYSDTPIQILTEVFEEGLPESLRKLGVAHYHGSPNNFSDLEKLNLDIALHILVLAKHEYNPGADSTTFDVVHRLMELNVVHKALIECVMDENRERLHNLGARSILRPIRTYPEIVVRALVAPGSETVLEDYFTHEGDHPRRYTFHIEQQPWKKIVSTLIDHDLGTAMAYIDKLGKVTPHPPANEVICAEALLVMVRANSLPDETEFNKILNELDYGH